MIRSVGAALVVVSALAAVGIPGGAPTAQAQELRLGGFRVTSDHELLGTSTALQASIAVGQTPGVGLRLGIQHGRAEFSSVGDWCVGLILPGQECPAELRAEESTTTTVFVALPVTASLGWGRWGIVPSVRRLAMESRQEGTTSGRVRSADKVAYGLGLGGELDVFVRDRPAVAFHAGVHAASHPFFEEEIAEDGRNPFERAVSLMWLELGLTIRPGDSWTP